MKKSGVISDETPGGFSGGSSGRIYCKTPGRKVEVEVPNSENPTRSIDLKISKEEPLKESKNKNLLLKTLKIT